MEQQELTHIFPLPLILKVLAKYQGIIYRQELTLVRLPSLNKRTILTKYQGTIQRQELTGMASLVNKKKKRTPYKVPGHHIATGAHIRVPFYLAILLEN